MIFKKNDNNSIRCSRKFTITSLTILILISLVYCDSCGGFINSVSSLPINLSNYNIKKRITFSRETIDSLQYVRSGPCNYYKVNDECLMKLNDTIKYPNEIISVISSNKDDN
jgi:hypothetical protein